MRRVVKRGDNLRFVASYLFLHPCAKPMDVIKALTAYNRVPDPSHSHYGDYVYHSCTYGRTHRFAHLWYRIRDNVWEVNGIHSRGRIMLQLTAKGMSYVDLDLVEKLEGCDNLADL